MDCIFCKIINGELPCSKVYEDSEFIAFLDIAPVNKGHTLIIPKNHYKDLNDFPDADGKCLSVVKKIAQAVVKGSSADGYNVSMNNGAAAGQIVFHAHIHVIPRFEGDGHEHWEKTSYEEGEMDEFCTNIAKHL